ncbi:ChaN family lipoprotein [Vibrio sp. SM6]|uniref:ChaN family lipoprotein n=1 Tax=Vibrio agarilyticus TaxID=2726741 RepID=A0A7X8YIB0_9VIBR|nr:ChaN family lipoprotein [Vibrio agarilyticus]NLS14529.1 ChaN family lipoprotein [Vibrio agarilyticus]
MANKNRIVRRWAYARHLVLTALMTSSLAFADNSALTPDHFYDYRLSTPSLEPLQLDTLVSRLHDVDVILVGEWHTHPAVHHLQFELLRALHQQRSDVVLSLEHFSREAQHALDQYLSGQIGETPFINLTQAWPNYASDYRPLIEYAKQHQIPVIAANAPNTIVRCIARYGLAYRHHLPHEEQKWIAKHVDVSSSPYKSRFTELMFFGNAEHTERQYAAQKTWDDTMAESIVTHLANASATQIIHYAGAFHVEQGQGIAATIRKLNPSLTVAILSPANPTLSAQIGYLIHLLPMPTRYLPTDNIRRHYHQSATRQPQHNAPCYPAPKASGIK